MAEAKKSRVLRRHWLLDWGCSPDSPGPVSASRGMHDIFRLMYQMGRPDKSKVSSIARCC
jgi:hypothetical protein